MVIFVDTSALFALISGRDVNHQRAKAQWRAWLDSPDDFIISNYVLLETTALLQSRLGMQAVQDFHDLLLPVMTVYWITEAIHKKALQTLLVANRRRLSLVDCTSFAVMNALGLQSAFTFDDHFAQAGFILLPGS